MSTPASGSFFFRSPPFLSSVGCGVGVQDRPGRGVGKNGVTSRQRGCCAGDNIDRFSALGIVLGVKELQLRCVDWAIYRGLRPLAAPLPATRLAAFQRQPPQQVVVGLIEPQRKHR